MTGHLYPAVKTRMQWVVFAAALVTFGAALEAFAADWQGYAILVGVSQYPSGYNGLQFCDDDALDIRDALLCDSQHWSEGNIEVILNRDATPEYIHNRIIAMQSRATGPDDVFLFFFSGHGSRADDDSSSPHPGDEDGPADQYDEVLVVWNAAGDDIDYIYDDHLGDWLSGFTCGHICVIVDSCYSGGMYKALSETAETWAEGFGRDLFKSVGTSTKDLQDSGQTGLVALMACNENELSKEDPVLQNGVFAFFVVEGLRKSSTDANSDGYVSAEEVFNYASPLAKSWASEPGSPQNPQLYDADPSNELKLLVAGDYGTFKVVHPEELPFGGGGCAGGPGGGSLIFFMFFAAASLMYALRRSRLLVRCRAAAVALAAYLAGCYYYPPQSYWPQPVYVPAGSQTAQDAAVQPATPYYVWTPRGYVLVQPQPVAPAPQATEKQSAEKTQEESPVQQPVQPPVVLPPAAPAMPVQWPQADKPRFGVRLGAVLPLFEKNAEYSAAAEAGIFFYGALPGSKLRYEVGLDFFSLEGSDVDAAGDVACARLDFVFARENLSGKAEPYFVAGGKLYADRARTYWGTTDELAVGASISGGLRRPERGWDARLGLDALIGSENIGGFLYLLGGVRF